MKSIRSRAFDRLTRAALMPALLFLLLSGAANSADSTVPQSSIDTSEAIKILKIQKSGPFSTEAEIVIKIENECHAAISVCTPMDAVVRQWEAKEMKPGKHIIKWDGRNDLGQAVASGVYLLKVQSQFCKKTEMLALLH